jgi:hypothetical protein
MARWVPIKTKGDELKQFIDQYRRKGRSLVDENMGEAAADLLRSLGCRVTFVGDVGLTGR